MPKAKKASPPDLSEPDRWLRNALSSAKVVNEEDPEADPDSEIGICDMAEYAQGMACEIVQLDAWLRRGGALPSRWRRATSPPEAGIPICFQFDDVKGTLYEVEDRWPAVPRVGDQIYRPELDADLIVTEVLWGSSGKAYVRALSNTEHPHVDRRPDAAREPK